MNKAISFTAIITLLIYTACSDGGDIPYRPEQQIPFVDLEQSHAKFIELSQGKFANPSSGNSFVKLDQVPRTNNSNRVTINNQNKAIHAISCWHTQLNLGKYSNITAELPNNEYIAYYTFWEGDSPDNIRMVHYGVVPRNDYFEIAWSYWGNLDDRASIQILFGGPIAISAQNVNLVIGDEDYLTGPYGRRVTASAKLDCGN